MRLSLLAVILATASLSTQAETAQTATFKAAAATGGWVELKAYTNLGLFLPVTIDGHETMAWLWGGPTTLDKDFAPQLAPSATIDGDGTVAGLEIRAGDVTLHNSSAKTGDLNAQAYGRYVGQPVTVRLGESMFDQVAVDLDYANRRVAFRDPKTLTKPPGAIELPLITLKRLSGPFNETVVTVDRLTFAGVDFAKVPIALIPDTELPPASITGGVGLPLLAKFRLIIDYSHDRLFAIPNNALVKQPIDKDRIGLVLGKQDQDFLVRFVAPDSPAAAAGFQKGDKIAEIDGKNFDAWDPKDIIKFYLAEEGTTHSFTMADGTTRQVKAVDFF